jgi:hypothetical protein
MNLFQRATKDCTRSDCQLVSSGGFSTCMGYMPTYDKNGTRTDRGDPNIHSSSLHCMTCGNRWHISTQYNETTITPSNTDVSHTQVVA